MTTTTMPTPSGLAMAGDNPSLASQAASRSPSVAPEKAPDTTPTRVMPVWTEEMNLPGSSASRWAMAAPRLPLLASSLRRAGREETTASSDIDRKPLSSVSATTTRISKNRSTWSPHRPMRQATYTNRSRWREGSALVVVGEGVLAATQPEADRRAGHAEGLAHVVDEVALIGRGHGIWPRGKDDEARRAHAGLRHVAEFQSPAGDRRRRMRFGGRVEPAIELGGRDVGVPDLLGGKDRLHQPVDVAAGEARERYQRHAAQLRQQAFAGFAQPSQRAGLVLDQIPFVEGDDEAAPFPLDQIGECQVLLFEGDRGIEQQHDDLGILDRAQGIGHCKLFELLRDARAAANAS